MKDTKRDKFILAPGDGVQVVATRHATIEIKTTSEGPDSWEHVRLNELLKEARQEIYRLKVEIQRLTERAEIAEGVIADLKDNQSHDFSNVVLEGSGKVISLLPERCEATSDGVRCALEQNHEGPHASSDIDPVHTWQEEGE